MAEANQQDLGADAASAPTMSQAEAGAASTSQRTAEMGSAPSTRLDPNAMIGNALSQLATLDWALLSLIPAAELQAVDRSLSLDPVDVDKVTSTFFDAASCIQQTFTELRVQALDSDEASQLSLEIYELEQELQRSSALVTRVQAKVASWQEVLSQQRSSLSKSLDAV